MKTFVQELVRNFSFGKRQSQKRTTDCFVPSANSGTITHGKTDNLVARMARYLILA
jgi:hypothetical protein